MDAFGSSILLILLCLVLSAFFSGTETAITSLSPLKSKHMREHGGRWAHVLDIWLDKPQRVIAAILICNNVVNIFASVYADHMASEILGTQISPVATTAVMTVLIVFFSEIVPKTVAKAYATVIAVPMLYVFRIFYWLFLPLTIVSDLLVSGLTGLLIRRDIKADPQITEEELEFLINVGEEEGVLEEDKHGMLSGVFELGDTVVREIMVHRIDMTALPVSSTIVEAADILRDTGLSRVPVYEDRIDNIVGIVHAKDVLFFLKKHKDDPLYWDGKLQDLKRDAMFVPESKPVDQLFQELRRHRQHMAVVLDEYGGTSGLVTMEDIFEEIVGEVRDEFDNEEDVIRPTPVPNQYLVECKIHIDDFCEFFDMDATEICQGHQANEFDTLGGLILYHFGQIPKIGDSLTIKRLQIEIIEVSKRRVRRALARAVEQSPGQSDEQVEQAGVLAGS
jgi:putative hemolysin